MKYVLQDSCQCNKKRSLWRTFTTIPMNNFLILLRPEITYASNKKFNNELEGNEYEKKGQVYR